MSNASQQPKTYIKPKWLLWYILVHSSFSILSKTPYTVAHSLSSLKYLCIWCSLSFPCLICSFLFLFIYTYSTFHSELVSSPWIFFVFSHPHYLFHVSNLFYSVMLHSNGQQHAFIQYRLGTWFCHNSVTSCGNDWSPPLVHPFLWGGCQQGQNPFHST